MTGKPPWSFGWLMLAAASGVAGFILLAGQARTETASSRRMLAADPPRPHLLQAAEVDNALQVSARVLSGATPIGAPAFAWLAEQGVRTIVSVDGAIPQVDLAARHGMRYVHVPLGYGAIPGALQRELSSLRWQTLGPYYVHCHHGKHRGPAAAVVVAMADGALSPEDSHTVLRMAGTDTRYQGLWQSVANYQALELHVLPTLVAAQEVGDLTQHMVRIDRAFQSLLRSRRAQWKPTSAGRVSSLETATLLRQRLQESARQLRTADTVDAQFLAELVATRDAAAQLEHALESSDFRRAADRALTELESHCIRCHQKHR